MIETYLLEQLAAFHQYGTLSAAAQHLHLAQPSLSRSMQKLETLLGVSLFERQKNRIVLNPTGALAAQHAEKILAAHAEMERHIKAFDRSLHTLAIGSCAPGPLMELLPSITTLYAGQTITSKIENEELLLQGLQTDQYHFIILTHPYEEPDYINRFYKTEQLYLSVSPMHPAAAYPAISFAQMDGQNFIMYAQVGFWEDIVRQKMPRSRFFLQNDLEAVGELARYSDLPSFASDITLKLQKSRQAGRIHIPFSDAESRAAYYLIYRKTNQTKWKTLLQSI